MKALLIVLLSLAVTGSTIQRAEAHDGWSTAGKILTGVVAGSIIAGAFSPPPATAVPVYAAPPVVFAPAPPPIVYTQPAPVVVYSQPIYVQPGSVYVVPPPVVLRHSSPGYCYRPRYRICW
jgi:hypothetical protein